MQLNLQKIKINPKDLKPILFKNRFFIVSFSLTFLFALSLLFVNYSLNNQKKANSNLEVKLKDVSSKLTSLKNQDQYKINATLKENIKNIQDSYKSSLGLYQRILDLKAQKQDTTSLDKEFAQSLSYLSDLNYSSASASLKVLSFDIKKKEDDLAASQVQISAPQNVTQSNTPPSNGFSVQSVTTDNGNFTVYIVAADLNSTRVVVDTASSGDCSNNCPTLPLSDYVSRSGAYAGINGSFFCPQEYPRCAGKTGSFDLLVMNKNKVYFNSSNNVYSTNPAVIFTGNSARFVGQALEWGRDTGVDSVLSNYPLLVAGGNIVYSGGGDAKFSQKGPRGFVANKGNTAYIGDVLNATMDDSAKVLKALGMENAMNLDEGGSTALWDGGYKLGPGRNIPNALLFVRK
ncbi:MAG TPA: phosphodiester glycosidase family protein [Candidatus Sulfotelmatobacter sp.]|nr:phosphodiester glycosidase family protein [Candidatus Sulfotelmatobacter sp.]